ncbi:MULTISPECIES: nitric oxide synthase oxygenase [Novosphingobium]|uniref:Nitric oxide synthase oxygenase n=1 Tax=Novosphingobium subterraneum TaxID=48936 RepID=A0A0B8ZPS2_9SPHN|nr:MULTISPECIES: nitric oxide synthase oxygenase [Novosphingobium]KHS45116.1 Nitric oxide synthase oxygenase [Novosphingobium subterraneum]
MTNEADRFVQSDPVRRRLRRLTRSERIEEAVAFIRQFASETGQSSADADLRIRDIRRSIRQKGTYWHSPDELVFGARVAWRNHARCVGRLTWKSLQVNDCRTITDCDEVVDRTLMTLRQSLSGGELRSAITIFAPATVASMPPTFESAQIFRYAGYMLNDGAVIGDRANIELTQIAQRLGWIAPAQPTNFDLLPLIMRTADGVRHAYNIPSDLRHEVPIHHNSFPGLSDLGLRWYGVPVVTNMVLTIGGIDYPCAPFSGHYVATEIASRNFIDPTRYDLLDTIARAFGFSPDKQERSLWKDHTLTELNQAVLDSFRQARITIADHHSVSDQYVTFAQLEHRAGRTPSGEWPWIVPPQAAAACPTFHLPMANIQAVPNFYVSRHIDGASLAIDRTSLRDGKWRTRYERLKRRWRNWRKRRDYIWQRA